MRRQAFDIGKEHPDAKRKNRSVYYDAYFARVARPLH